MEQLSLKLPFLLNTVSESPKQQPIDRPDGAPWNQFIWIKSGKGFFTVDGDPYILSEGEGIFMRHGVQQSYSRIGDTLHTKYCTFFSPDSLVDYCIGNKRYVTFEAPDFLNRETDILRKLARSNASTLELSAAGYTYVTELFSAITKNCDDIISKVCCFLEDNCAKPLTLDDIAAVAGLDRFALCRYFKKHHKRSVMDELKAIRIKKAKRLLLYSTESIGEIGRLCGFESPSYFTLRFREECGCSPAKYREIRM